MEESGKRMEENHHHPKVAEVARPDKTASAGLELSDRFGSLCPASFAVCRCRAMHGATRCHRDNHAGVCHIHAHTEPFDAYHNFVLHIASSGVC